MSIIKVEHLSFTHDASSEMLFDDVSFQIDTDWKTGLIGRNGKGKTTLLNLFMKKLDYSGTIQSNVIFDLFPFEVHHQNYLTLDLLTEIHPQVETWEIAREIKLLKMDSDDLLYRPFETLSYGEQTRVLLALLFCQKNHFLLIDEPTNHLDMEAREVLAEYLKRKSGFLLISHDRTFLDRCIDHVLAINQTQIEVMQGNFSTWKQNKDFQDQFELNENEKLKKEIGRLKKAAEKQAVWSFQVEATKNGTRVAGIKPDKGAIGAQAARVMKKAKNAEKRMNQAILQKENLLHNLDYASSLKLTVLPHHSQNLIHAQDLSLFYDDRILFERLNFELKQKECLSILGANGSGKSSLIRCILGKNCNFRGTLTIAPNLVISYVSQDTSWLKGTCHQFAIEQQIDQTLFLTILRKLDFRRELFERDFITYSEGQKKKVLIAASLTKPAHLYIWDEPLNYIDVLSRIQIEKLILSLKPTMILIEHDHSFIEAVATQTLRL